jgi:hypothetical protein
VEVNTSTGSFRGIVLVGYNHPALWRPAQFAAEDLYTLQSIFISVIFKPGRQITGVADIRRSMN